MHRSFSAKIEAARSAAGADGCDGGARDRKPRISATRVALVLRCGSSRPWSRWQIDGAVLLMIDIDAAKRGLDFAEAIVETVREPLVILNQNLQVMNNESERSSEAFHSGAGRDGGSSHSTTCGNGQWQCCRNTCASCWRAFCPRTRPSAISRVTAPNL